MNVPRCDALDDIDSWLPARAVSDTEAARATGPSWRVGGQGEQCVEISRQRTGRRRANYGHSRSRDNGDAAMLFFRRSTEARTVRGRIR